MVSFALFFGQSARGGKRAGPMRGIIAIRRPLYHEAAEKSALLPDMQIFHTAPALFSLLTIPLPDAII